MGNLTESPSFRAFYEGPEAYQIRESSAATDSALMSTLRGYRVASEIVLAHIRRASFGPVELRNTRPFRRELHGWVHVNNPWQVENRFVTTHALLT